MLLDLGEDKDDNAKPPQLYRCDERLVRNELSIASGSEKQKKTPIIPLATAKFCQLTEALLVKDRNWNPTANTNSQFGSERFEAVNFCPAQV
jgi:hypothetical protein